MTERILLTIREAAAALRLSEKTLWAWRALSNRNHSSGPLSADSPIRNRPNPDRGHRAGTGAELMAAEPQKGRFFVIDARIWAKVTARGMNEAVAYLVLAYGTGRDNRTTRWSSKALHKHAGIAWTRGQAAIESLIQARFVCLVEIILAESQAMSC